MCEDFLETLLCPGLQVSVTKCPLILFTLLFVLARNTDNKQRHKVLMLVQIKLIKT